MKDRDQVIKFKERFSRINSVEDCIKKTREEYRTDDLGGDSYRRLFQLRKENKDIFSDDYLELVYETLGAWKMNRRAAKLKDPETFKKIIRLSEKNIRDLINFRLGYLSNNELEEAISIMHIVFKDLKEICGQKSKIVTISKCLHFLLPELVMPMDRQYTLRFFMGTMSPDSQISIPDDIEKQFLIFKNIIMCSNEFVKGCSQLESYLDNGWNRNIPKVLDSIIIGYVKIHLKKKEN